MTRLHIIEIGSFRQPSITETTAYRNGRVQSGYTSKVGVGIEVTRGVEVDLNIDLTVTTISEKTFNEWKTHAYTYVSVEQRQYLEEHYSGYAEAGGWFGGIMGAIYAGGDYHHYRTQEDSYSTEVVQNSEGFAKSMYELKKEDLRITGNVKIKGESNIPSTAYIYLFHTRIKFSDGTELVVFDTSNPMSADRDGNLGNTTVSGSKLNIIENSLVGNK